jgi:hypothetical protein
MPQAFAFRAFGAENDTQLKTRTIILKDGMVRVLRALVACKRSTDKHLILSVGLIDGLRHGRNENFEAPAEARHNRG